MDGLIAVNPATAYVIYPRPRTELPKVAWAAYGGDDQLTNFAGASPVTPDRAGTLLASALAFGDTVFAFTESGSVYALRKDTGEVLWQRAFGDRVAGASCGRWGITSTGAIDRAVFDPVPGPFNLGGPWGYGGVSIDPDGGFVYVALGNSDAHDPECDCRSDIVGLGNSIVRLTPALEVVESHRPTDVPVTGDYDFGAAPLLFQPRGCEPLAAANNKNGRLDVWKRHALAEGPVESHPVGTVSAPFVAGPSWSPRRQMLFVAGARVITGELNVGDGVQAFAVDRCRLKPTWATVTGVGTQPPPLLVGDVVFTVGGFRGGFYALSAITGRMLWRFPTGVGTLAPAIAVGDLVYVGDSAGVLRAFSVATGPAP